MKTFYAKDRTEWRRWLRANHRKEPGIWFVFYRKHTGKRLGWVKEFRS